MFSYGEKNYFLSLTKSQTHLALYALFLVAIPIFLTSQLFVGIAVNALLISAALKYGIKKNFLLAFLPSFGAVAGGLLFASFTPYLLVMLPFIWAANLTLMTLTRKLVISLKKNYFAGTLLAAAAKTSLLFLSAFVLYSIAFVPVAFLTAFGIMQFITAAGGTIIVGALRLHKH